MRKIAIFLVVVVGIAGCKRVDVSLPIPVRLKGTVTIDGPAPDFSEGIAIPADILMAKMPESIEGEDELTVSLESVVLVVSRNECQVNTLVEGEVDVSSAVHVVPSRLALVESMNLTEVLGETVHVQLDSVGVNILNGFAQNAIEGSGGYIGVVVAGTASSSPVDFDIDVILTFTLVVVTEMMSIGF